MSVGMILTSVLSLTAGVGIFLVSCIILSGNLQALGGAKLKALFRKTSGSKLWGVGIGALTAAVIQSSSATSVMAIGFVNGGIMSLSQAATVIYGANIGTTVTGLFVAFGMIGEGAFSVSAALSAFAGVGAFVIMFSDTERTRKIGYVIAAFGMLFEGLSLMSGAMSSFAELDALKYALSLFRNPILLLLIGTAATAVVQSSSVMTSVSITMLSSGLITLEQGIYITMGANIGSCVTALLAGFAGAGNARRAALIHLIFNTAGAVAFTAVGMIAGLFGFGYGVIFGEIFADAPQIGLAVFHTVFNVATALFMLPLTERLVKLTVRISPDNGACKNTRLPKKRRKATEKITRK